MLGFVQKFGRNSRVVTPLSANPLMALNSCLTDAKNGIYSKVLLTTAIENTFNISNFDWHQAMPAGEFSGYTAIGAVLTTLINAINADADDAILVILANTVLKLAEKEHLDWGSIHCSPSGEKPIELLLKLVMNAHRYGDQRWDLFQRHKPQQSENYFIMNAFYILVKHQQSRGIQWHSSVQQGFYQGVSVFYAVMQGVERGYSDALAQLDTIIEQPELDWSMTVACYRGREEEPNYRDPFFSLVKSAAAGHQAALNVLRIVVNKDNLNLTHENKTFYNGYIDQKTKFRLTYGDERANDYRVVYWLMVAANKSPSALPSLDKVLLTLGQTRVGQAHLLYVARGMNRPDFIALFTKLYNRAIQAKQKYPNSPFLLNIINSLDVLAMVAAAGPYPQAAWLMVRLYKDNFSNPERAAQWETQLPEDMVVATRGVEVDESRRLQEEKRNQRLTTLIQFILQHENPIFEPQAIQPGVFEMKLANSYGHDERFTLAVDRIFREMDLEDFMLLFSHSLEQAQKAPPTRATHHNNNNNNNNNTYSSFQQAIATLEIMGQHALRKGYQEVSWLMAGFYDLFGDNVKKTEWERHQPNLYATESTLWTKVVRRLDGLAKQFKPHVRDESAGQRKTIKTHNRDIRSQIEKLYWIAFKEDPCASPEFWKEVRQKAGLYCVYGKQAAKYMPPKPDDRVLGNQNIHNTMLREVAQAVLDGKRATYKLRKKEEELSRQLGKVNIT